MEPKKTRLYRECEHDTMNTPPEDRVYPCGADSCIGNSLEPTP